MLCLSHDASSAATVEEAAPAPAITDPAAPLSDDEIAGFMEEGYVALPGIIPDEHRLRLNADVDRLEADLAAVKAQAPALEATALD